MRERTKHEPNREVTHVGVELGGLLEDAQDAPVLDEEGDNHGVDADHEQPREEQAVGRLDRRRLEDERDVGQDGASEDEKAELEGGSLDLGRGAKEGEEDLRE